MFPKSLPKTAEYCRNTKRLSLKYPKTATRASLTPSDLSFCSAEAMPAWSPPSACRPAPRAVAYRFVSLFAMFLLALVLFEMLPQMHKHVLRLLRPLGFAPKLRK